VRRLLVCLVALGAVAAAPLDQGQSDAFYAQQLGRSGLRIIDRQDVDLTGDGVPETLLLAVGEGCGSCHTKHLAIFSGQRSLADVSFDDPQLDVHPGVGVWVTQPVRLPDEPLCCPTGTFTLQVLWDAGRNDFKFGSPVAIGPGLDHPDAPRHSVATYYSLLDAGLFEQAFDLLSSRVQAQLTYRDWLQALQPTDYVFPIAVERVAQTSGQVHVELKMVDSSSSGVWQTVPEDGAWRLDSFRAD
jgi:hypothetical protein